MGTCCQRQASNKDEMTVTRGMLEFAPHDRNGDYHRKVLFPNFNAAAPDEVQAFADAVLQEQAAAFESKHPHLAIEWDEEGAHLKYAHFALLGGKCLVCDSPTNASGACVKCGSKAMRLTKRPTRVKVLEDKGPQKRNLDQLTPADLPRAYTEVMDFFAAVNEAERLCAMG